MGYYVFNSYSSAIPIHDKKREKLEKALQEMGMSLFVGERRAGMKEDFFLFSSIFVEAYVRGLDSSNKDFKKNLLRLSELRSYIHTLGSFVDEGNFLNDFENFSQNGNEKAYSAAKSFVNSEEKKKGLWISGKPGTGKTHLLLSVAQDLIKKSTSFYFNLLPDEKVTYCPIYEETAGREGFPKIWAKSYSNEKETPGRQFYISTGADKILLLDDVYELDKNEIMNELIKIFAQKQGSLAITSNLSLSEWVKIASGGKSPAGLEERIRTFMTEVSTNGDSRRSLKK